MADQPENGEIGTRDGKECVYFDGYWIRHYPPPADTLSARKRLIDGLTRRTFHHTSIHGSNNPTNSAGSRSFRR